MNNKSIFATDHYFRYMKKTFILAIFLIATATAFSQQSFVTVSGGYSFAKVEDSDVMTNGWRVNGLYEFNPYEQKWTYGLSFGYLNLKGFTADRDYNISSLPLYFAPKYMSGSDKLKGFIKEPLECNIQNWKQPEVPLTCLITILVLSQEAEPVLCFS